MQEEVTRKTIALAIKTAKLDGKVLQAALRKLLQLYFAVSALLFCFFCELRQSKKVCIRHRGIPHIYMNSEIM